MNIKGRAVQAAQVSTKKIKWSQKVPVKTLDPYTFVVSFHLGKSLVEFLFLAQLHESSHSQETMMP